jgi:hypothetical protein
MFCLANRSSFGSTVVFTAPRLARAVETTEHKKGQVTMKAATIAMALAMAAAALNLRAQDAGGPPPREGDGPGGRGAGVGGPGGEHKRPMPPLIAALDANSDGVIDADEIAKAPESLKKLDKNGDGKLTPEECMPPRPQGGPGGEARHGGQGGQNKEGRAQPPALEK